MARSSSRAPAPAASPRAKPSPAAPHVHYEFSGPYLGPVGIILGLPVLTFAYAAYCGPDGWPSVPTSALTPRRVLDDALASWSTEAFLVYTAYWLYTALLYLVLPGASGRGVVLPDGRRLAYPFNGLASLLVVVATALGIHHGQPFGPRFTLLYITDNFPQLVTATIAFSFLLSVFLYWFSFQRPAASDGAPAKVLAAGGDIEQAAL